MLSQQIILLKTNTNREANKLFFSTLDSMLTSLYSKSMDKINTILYTQDDDSNRIVTFLWYTLKQRPVFLS